MMISRPLALYPVWFRATLELTEVTAKISFGLIPQKGNQAKPSLL
jgi:hypothetical protein